MPQQMQLEDGPALSVKVLLCLTLLAVGGLSAHVATHAAERGSSCQPQKIVDCRLENAYRVHARVISGAQPDERAFQALRELGVKTMISVDGARPDVQLAKKYGMQYVHLPHGYDGVPEHRVDQLAKAVRDLDGPVYVHCHHGKHRGPAAAATACVAAGLIASDDALTLLQAAGTSEHYRGLYQSVRSARPLDPTLLDQLNVEFPEAAAVAPLAEAMVAIEEAHDHLKTIAESGWQAPEEHPDLEPAHEALLLREQYTELLRNTDVDSRGEGFRAMLREGEVGAKKLERILRAGKMETEAEKTTRTADEVFATLTQNCKACHRRFRDIPLSEKTGR